VRPDASPRTITSVGTRRRSWTSSTRRITHRARIHSTSAQDELK
jgi:hypothetical protein